jgi:hypothetical protein
MYKISPNSKTHDSVFVVMDEENACLVHNIIYKDIDVAQEQNISME